MPEGRSSHPRHCSAPGAEGWLTEAAGAAAAIGGRGATCAGGAPLAFALTMALAASNNLISTSNPVLAMVTGPAGYRPRDLWRIGAPLTVAIGGGLSMLGGMVFLARLPSLRARARQIGDSEQVGAEAPLVPVSARPQEPAPQRTR